MYSNETKLSQEELEEILRAAYRKGAQHRLALENGSDIYPCIMVRRVINPRDSQRRTKELSWIVRFNVDPKPCDECCRALYNRPMTSTKALQELAWLIWHIKEQVNLHRCVKPNLNQAHSLKNNAGRVEPLLDLTTSKVKIGESKETARDRNVAMFTPHKPLVRVISSSANAATVENKAPLPRLEAYPDALESTGVRSDLTIHYKLASGVRVTVKIPDHLSKLLISKCNESNAHAHEVGGVLVGYRIPTDSLAGSHADYQVEVTDLIPIESNDSSTSHIRFDRNAWRFISQEFETKFEKQNKFRLGWYHTHPTQGVFYSHHDVDTHTIFRQPFQFGLVVDPRMMLAGLFYWNDYERKSLYGPVKFRLSPRLFEASGSDDQEAVEPERTLQSGLSKFRVALALIIETGIIVQGLRGSELKLFAITPDYACVLAFTALIHIRLWNAGFFHPYEPIESLIGTKALQHIRRVKAALLSLLKLPHINKKQLVVTILALLAAVLVYEMFNSSLINRFLNPVPIQSENSEAWSDAGGKGQKDSAARPSGGDTKTNEPDSNAEVQDIYVFINETPGGEREYVFSAGTPAIRLHYLVRFAGSAARQLDFNPLEEEIFFRNAFFLEITGPRARQDFIRQFQLALDMKQQSTGSWRNLTRNAFLSKAQSLKQSGELLIFQPSSSVEYRYKFK